MTIEDYFDFLSPNDIRLKGNRIGIETVLYEYIHRAQTPEQIVQTYSTLTLEQVHATVLYYLHNKEAVDSYIADWLDYSRCAREEQERNPPPSLLRVRKVKTALAAAHLTIEQYLHDPEVRARIDSETGMSAGAMAA